jgi:hypothetical protein
MSSLPPGSVTETCYVTADLARAVHHWGETFRAGPFFALTVPESFGTRSYRGRPAQDSFTAEVLEERGDLAVHHVYPNVRPITAAEFDEQRARYERAGYVAALDMVLPGLGRNVLFDARPKLGVFIELLEVSPAMFAGVERMLHAHQTWDGLRPLREFAETMG